MHLNIVIISTCSSVEIFIVVHFFKYILKTTCQMHLIQNALSQAISGAHGKTLSVIFRQFFTSVGTFEVKISLNWNGISTICENVLRPSEYDFFKIDKIALSYREIIFTCPVIMRVIPRNCLDLQHYLLYA